MTPEQLASEIRNSRFRRVLWGYHPGEVEKLLAVVLERYRALYAEKETLANRLAAYEKQEEILRRALIRAEEAAVAIKKEAEREAEALRAQAASAVASLQDDAAAQLQALEKEAKEYREQLYQRFYSYEREARLLLDRFYSSVRRHIDGLEKELVSEVQGLMRRVDEDIASLPKPSLQPLAQVAAATQKNTRGGAGAEENWEEKEEALLVGYTLLTDICDEDGHLVVPSGTIVTPELIQSLTAKGLYGELVSAIAGHQKGEEKPENAGRNLANAS